MEAWQEKRRAEREGGKEQRLGLLGNLMYKEEMHSGNYFSTAENLFQFFLWTLYSHELMLNQLPYNLNSLLFSLCSKSQAQ